MTTQNKPMTRVNLFMPKNMDAKLRELSEKTGAPVAEIIRRAVAAHLLRMK
jgi:predicted DNA-binding protein